MRAGLIPDQYRPAVPRRRRVEVEAQVVEAQQVHHQLAQLHHRLVERERLVAARHPLVQVQPARRARQVAAVRAALALVLVP